MKKFLSLVLALAMTMSLVTISAGAKDFTDADDITYVEAVEVMTAIGVVDGDTAGNFNPTSGLTRGAAAKIICNMILGPTTASALNADANPYKDVNKNSTFAGYIAYCAKEGIISGYADGTFRPAAPLSGYAFMKMLLGALGYDAQIEQYVGANWSINVAKQAISIGLDDGLKTDFNGSNYVTREEAMLFAFNTLQATMVDYGTRTSISVGDIAVTTQGEAEARDAIPGRNYNNVASTEEDFGTLQFCEMYFSKLVWGNAAADNVDGLMRPSHTWYVKNDKVGEYADAADYTFVVGEAQTASKLITDELGSATVQTGSIAYVNGASNATTAGTNLRVGDVVEIFMSSANTRTVATVAVTRYSGDEVTANPTTKGTGDDAKVRIPGVIGYTKQDDVIGWEDLKEDDIVYFYLDNDGVYHFNKADYVEGKLTSVNNKNPLSYVIGDTKYVVNGSCATNGLNATDVVFNTLYRFYLDDNGYAVWGAEVEDTLSDYVVIQDMKYVAVDGNSNLGDSDRVQARLVKMDGTTLVVTIASIKMIPTGETNVFTYTDIDTSKAFSDQNTAVTGSYGRYLAVDASGNTGFTSSNVNAVVLGQAVDNVFFTYTINSDGEYELSYVKGNNITTSSANSVTFNAGKAYVGTTPIAVDDNTVFVVAKETNDYKFNVYTGKKNVPDMTGASVAYVLKDGVASYVYVDAYTSSIFAGDSIFFMEDEPISYYQVKKDDGSIYGYNLYNAVVNGEATTVKVAANAPGIGQAPATANNTNTGVSVAVALFNPTYNTDGVVTNLTAVPSLAQTMAFGYKVVGTTLVTGKTGTTYANAYVCDDDAVVYYMDTDDEITTGYASDLSADDNDQIYVVLTNTTDNEVDYVFVVEKDSDCTDIFVETSVTDPVWFQVGTYDMDQDGTAETYDCYQVKTGETLTITGDAGCTIQYTVNNSDWSHKTSVQNATSAITIPAAGQWINVKVIAEDESVGYIAFLAIA